MPERSDDQLAVLRQGAAYEQGRADERERVSAIRALAMPGFEAEERQAIEDGSTAEQFATRVLAIQRDRGTTLAAQQADSTHVEHAAYASANDDPVKAGWARAAQKAAQEQAGK